MFETIERQCIAACEHFDTAKEMAKEAKVVINDLKINLNIIRILQTENSK